MTTSDLEKELQNAKDPQLAILHILGEHFEGETKVHKDLFTAIEEVRQLVTALQKDVSPLTETIGATKFVRHIAGWAILTVIGIIKAYQYLIDQVRNAAH
jgi:hypothetical protein